MTHLHVILLSTGDSLREGAETGQVLAHVPLNQQAKTIPFPLSTPHWQGIYVPLSSKKLVK